MSSRSRAIPGVGKGAERNGCLRAETQVAKGFQNSLQVVAIELKDQVEIEGRAKIPVQHDGNSPHHQIADARLLESCQNPLDAATHSESLPWSEERERGRAPSAIGEAVRIEVS